MLHVNKFENCFLTETNRLQDISSVQKKKKGLTKDYERIAVWGLQTMVSHLQIPHKNEEENSCIEVKRNLGELE